MAITFSFQKSIEFMKDAGFYEYLLPFILIFAIVFAILEKTKIFGKKKTNINVLIAIVVAFLLIAEQTIVTIINSFLPKVSLMFIVIIVALMTIAMISGKESKGVKGASFGLLIIIAFIAIIASLWGSFPGTSGTAIMSDQDASMLLSIAIPIIVLLIVGYFLTRPSGDDPNSKSKGMRKFLETLGNEFGDSD